jgi:Protein of unknown function (DUF664)
MDSTRSRLLAALDQGRRHVLGIVDGLSDEQLRRAVLPSGWTCVGLINHLAIDVELFWFQAVVRGDQAAWDALDAWSGSAWAVGPDEHPKVVLGRYEEEIRRANEVIASTPLDTAPARWPDFFSTYRLHDLEEVMLHVITETAAHAGHLDAARELIDGRQWVVL